MEPTSRGSVGRALSQVDPWNYMIDKLCDLLEEEDIQDLMVRMFGIDYNDDEGIEMELDRREEVIEIFKRKMTDGRVEQNKVRELLDALNDQDYYVRYEKLSDMIQEFYTQYDQTIEEIDQHKIFVGRDGDIQEILNILETKEQIKCVSICGIGGQGKTTLASYVCKRLNWKTFKADMRDKEHTADMMKALLLGAGKVVSQSDDKLKQEFMEFLSNIQGPTLFYVDDCDKMMSNDWSFYQFLGEIISFVNNLPNKVRFLLTTRVKFDDRRIQAFKSHIKQVELDSLMKSDAVELLCKTSGKEIQHMQAEEIVTECACSPLAVTTVAAMIKEEKFTVERLLLHLKMDKRNVTKALKIDNCIRVTVENLSDDVRESLVRLTVFQASLFDFQSAKSVCPKITEPTEEQTCNFDTRPISLSHLQTLYNMHLLDYQGRGRSRHKSLNDGDGITAGDESGGMYSLHPLVYKYLHEWRKKPKQLESAFIDASKKFIELYESKIATIVWYMDTKCIKGLRDLELHRNHIKHFYNIHETKKALLTPYPKKSRTKDFLRKKRVSDLGDLLLPDVQKRRLFKSEAARAKDGGNDAMHILWTVNEADVYTRCCDKPEIAMELLDRLSQEIYPGPLSISEAARAKDGGNDAMYILWTVEEADVYTTLCDKPGIAMELLDKLSQGIYPALRGLHPDRFYPAIVHGLFHKVKGLTRWKQQQHEQGLQHLQLALKFFEHFNTGHLGVEEEDQKKDPNYKNLHAKIYSYIGQVYIELQKYEEANEALRMGYDIVKSNMTSRKDDKDMQWDIPRYLGYFGLISFKKGQYEQNPEQKGKYFDKALEYLNKGMDLDRKLKLDSLDGYCMKRRVKADVLIERKNYDAALREAEAALDQRRAIVQPPHFKYAESVHQVAKIYLLQGIEQQDKGNMDDAKNLWRTSRDYFTDMEDHHLINGSIEVGHPLYWEIKQNHFMVRQLYDGENSDSVKQLEGFYKKLEKGNFKSRAESHMKSFQSMLQTPKEFIQHVFGSGGKQFGERNVVMQKLEDHAGEQLDEMFGGRYGVPRQDSGHSSTSTDFGESMSSDGSGSMSHQMKKLKLDKSLSLEDNVFEAKDTPEKRGKSPIKRQKTIDEDL